MLQSLHPSLRLYIYIYIYKAIIFELFRIYQQIMFIGNPATNNLKIYFKKNILNKNRK